MSVVYAALDSFMQVITNFKVALTIKFGAEFSKLLSFVGLFNLDFQNIRSIRCLAKPSYVDEVNAPSNSWLWPTMLW